ncbi:DUF550 domain-containing protein [Flavobacterium psychrophilum]|uniref:DUF550 domain-containing protein n=1 Tax=Flavobacterium phage Fpv7 TaxID=1814287 RepID=UPI00078E1823|nr:dATP/dGTP pyrophosphohydrolase domain-containing protein [Flavobacterium psychrophilum]YP_009321248.1 DUF550 domain-containing protein [Flavobacterium phage Fpv7]YP_009322314.1 DUF550 domain-containing protein [Flavobacterium phage Fpv8]YP_009322420.1 DUF550 domain-containing protein [Flavobacterium phage Fpv5]YP_009323714.1 DUF550 domain-containing protein [Flavobacterium phage Fpv10]YP_009324566.1 DUF550 domain-containing protein [Flavobacterium phage Fpv6]YP_009325254.1 DUF550 domain-co
MKKIQFESINEWQTKTFGQATSLSKLSHLKQEIEELIFEIENNGKGKKLEFADCFILLFGAAASDGMTYEEICNVVDEKMEINKKRKWGVPNENGVVNHIKKYQPSNGTEGSIFMAKHCEQCIHEKFIHTAKDGDKQCDIATRSMIHNINDDEYPEEWTFDRLNQPICTKFKKHEWFDENGNLTEPSNDDFEIEDPNQIKMFE